MKKIIALLLLFTIACVPSISSAAPVSTEYIFLDEQLNTITGQIVGSNIEPVETTVRDSNKIVVITPHNAPPDINDNFSQKRFTVVIMDETTFNKFMDLR